MPLPERTSGERVLMREEAYRELRRLIVAGALGPAEHLRDKEIAAWFGVSRTPIREAITRLADEGLVEMAANRYTRVRPLSARDADEGYPMVATLHALAARAAAGSWAETQRALLLEEAERYSWALLREDPVELVAADDAVHEIIVLAAGNDLLIGQLERMVPRLRQLELSIGGEAASGRPDVHQALVTALDASDGAAAARLVDEEWLAVGRMVGQALRRSERVSG
jgi:DNA-binding GntR family transcriptional regulator